MIISFLKKIGKGTKEVHKTSRIVNSKFKKGKRSTKPPELYILNSKKERPWKPSTAFKLGSVVPDFLRQIQKDFERI